jgi:quercetin dioxygenase-like cupin family protein
VECDGRRTPSTRAKHLIRKEISRIDGWHAACANNRARNAPLQINHQESTMQKKLALRLAFGAAGLAATAATVTLALAQMAPPADNVGVAAKVIGSVPLAGEIDGVEGRQLRMRIVTLAPGGMFAQHSHKDRPSVEFVLKGSATEFRGDVKKDYKEGDSVLADKNTTHWWRNDGKEPTIFVAVDVFSAPK